MRGADIRFLPLQSRCWILWIYDSAPLRVEDEHSDSDIWCVFLLTSFLWFSFLANSLFHATKGVGSEPTRLTYLLDTTTAVEALEKGLDSLMDLCDVVTDKFTDARDKFNAEQADKMESWAQFGLDVCWLRLVILSVSGFVCLDGRFCCRKVRLFDILYIGEMIDLHCVHTWFYCAIRSGLDRWVRWCITSYHLVIGAFTTTKSLGINHRGMAHLISTPATTSKLQIEIPTE